jgi:glucose-6-phosphate 1-epimerase
VHLHGGCVTSYKAPHEVLAVRKDAAFDGSKPIAAGLQICWPQFGPGAIQQHGFARNLPWEVRCLAGSGRI